MFSFLKSFSVIFLKKYYKANRDHPKKGEQEREQKISG